MFELSYFETYTQETRFGPREVKVAYPTAAFWKDWKGAKEALQRLGYTVEDDPKRGFLVHKYAVRAVGSEDPLPPPPAILLKDTSYPPFLEKKQYQLDAAAHLVACLWTEGHACDLSDTGVGKTAQEILAAREMGLPVGVICTLRGIPKWVAWLKAFRVPFTFVTNWESAKSKDFPYGVRRNGFYRWTLNKRHLLIFDEAHKAKGRGSQNGALVVGAKSAGHAYILASASLATSPLDMEATGYALGLHGYHDFLPWAKERGCYMVALGGVNESGEAVGPAHPSVADPSEAMKEIHRILIPKKGVRVRIEDLGDAFPETHISTEEIALPPMALRKQNEAYGELVKKIEGLKAEKAEGRMAAEMTLNLRYRQMTEILKVDALADLAGEHRENGLSVIVFVNFTETLLALAKKLKTDCLIAGSGVLADKDVQENHRRFQANEERIILCNVAAGGASIDLHDVHGGHPRISLIAPTYRAIDLKQVLGRPHRQGGKSKSVQRLLFASGTVEEKICTALQVRLKSLSALNDGDLMEPDLLRLGMVPAAPEG